MSLSPAVGPLGESPLESVSVLSAAGNELEVSDTKQSLSLRSVIAAMKHALDAVVITEAEPADLPGPRILYVNPAFEEMTGYKRHEIVGQTPRILHGPNSDRATLDRIREALKAWRPIREELINYRKDGSEFYVDLSLIPVADEQGQYSHWIAIQRDTTAQNQVREQLSQSEERMRTLTETMPELLWTADAQGICSYVSHAFSTFVGVPYEGCVGSDWLELVHPEDRSAALTPWTAALADNRKYVADYRMRRHDGEYLWFHHQAVPRLNPDGTIIEWVGTSTDVSLQKRSEEALRQSEKLAAVGRLASSIAHEINNPLASVTNLLYLLSNDLNLNRTAREYVNTAQAELARVGEITTQTLRFYKQSTAAVPTHVAEILDSVLSLYRPRLASAQIQLLREYERTAPLTCLAGEVRQAFANIIGNAIDASISGGTLMVRKRTTRDWVALGGFGVRVTIADTGNGIPGEALSKVFDPFYTTKGMTGTGLGLWITKDLIAKHGGRISVRSSTQKGHSGTVFSIFLPFNHAELLTLPR